MLRNNSRSSRYGVRWASGTSSVFGAYRHPARLAKRNRTNGHPIGLKRLRGTDMWLRPAPMGSPLQAGKLAVDLRRVWCVGFLLISCIVSACGDQTRVSKAAETKKVAEQPAKRDFDLKGSWSVRSILKEAELEGAGEAVDNPLARLINTEETATVCVSVLESSDAVSQILGALGTPDCSIEDATGGGERFTFACNSNTNVTNSGEAMVADRQIRMTTESETRLPDQRIARLSYSIVADHAGECAEAPLPSTLQVDSTKPDPSIDSLSGM